MTQSAQRKLAMAIRIATVPPVMAAATILILHRHFPTEYSLSSLFFLTLAPVIAYPIWWVIPKLREGGRKTQRALAVALSVAGYLAGSLWCGFVSREYASLRVYLIYLISGGLIALFSYVFGIRGSGHASGVVGPVVVMVCETGSLVSARSGADCRCVLELGETEAAYASGTHAGWYIPHFRGDCCQLSAARLKNTFTLFCTKSRP